jgi:hypothetical protein
MEIESLNNALVLENERDTNLKDVIRGIRELGELLRDELITQEVSRSEGGNAWHRRSVAKNRWVLNKRWY